MDGEALQQRHNGTSGNTQAMHYKLQQLIYLWAQGPAQVDKNLTYSSRRIVIMPLEVQINHSLNSLGHNTTHRNGKTRKQVLFTYLFMRRRKALSAEMASCVLVIMASRCKTDRLTVITSLATLTEPCITQN